MFAAGAAERQWYTLSVDGERVGYAYREQRVENGERVDSLVTRIEITQLRQRSHIDSRTDVFRDDAGAPLRMRVESNAAIDRNGWRATFDAGTQQIEVAVDGVAGARTYHRPASLVLPDQLSDPLAPLWRGTKADLDFPYLMPAAARPVMARAERLSESPSGGALVPIRIITAGSDRSVAETLWIGANGEVRKRQQRFYGTPLIWEPCEQKCDAAVEHPFDLMARLVVSSPFRIPASAHNGPIRYVISRSDGLTTHLPNTGEQSVALDGPRAIVTICDTCGATESSSEADRQRYLQPNAWVQSDYAGVIGFARRYSGAGSAEQIMRQLVDGVREYMTGDVDYVGYASAREALRTRAGDCTEFAVLLAAAARARGIPARVVSGLVYTDRFSGKKDVFSPHTWVQAWTGKRWTSYDAGLGEFDATHIALAVGTGDPREAAPRSDALNPWRIERIGLVRAH
jgi:transglutaminase superfamily protein